MIAVAFIFFVLLVVIAGAGLFDNNSANDKSTSETNTLTKPNGISSAKMANVKHSKQVYDKLNTKYSDIMNPIIADIATSTPVLRICVPDTEWVKLANKDKVDLTYYLESLIPAVRNNPEPYITISPNAPIYAMFLSRAKSLCNDCWAIMECSWNTERKSWSLDRTLVQGDTPWYKDDPCCRGISASELLRTQSSTLSCSQGYSLEYNPPKGVWECV